MSFHIQGIYICKVSSLNRVVFGVNITNVVENLLASGTVTKLAEEEAPTATKHDKSTVT